MSTIRLWRRKRIFICVDLLGIKMIKKQTNLSLNWRYHKKSIEKTTRFFFYLVILFLFKWCFCSIVNFIWNEYLKQMIWPENNQRFWLNYKHNILLVSKHSKGILQQNSSILLGHTETTNWDYILYTSHRLNNTVSILKSMRENEGTKMKYTANQTKEHSFYYSLRFWDCIGAMVAELKPQPEHT